MSAGFVDMAQRHWQRLLLWVDDTIGLGTDSIRSTWSSTNGLQESKCGCNISSSVLAASSCCTAALHWKNIVSRLDRWVWFSDAKVAALIVYRAATTYRIAGRAENTSLLDWSMHYPTAVDVITGNVFKSILWNEYAHLAPAKYLASRRGSVSWKCDRRVRKSVRHGIYGFTIVRSKRLPIELRQFVVRFVAFCGGEC